MDQIIDISTRLLSAGPWGAATAVLVIGFSLWVYWKRLSMVQSKTEKKRAEEQAKNPVDNVIAEDDAQNAKEEIDKIISGKDN